MAAGQRAKRASRSSHIWQLTYSVHADKPGWLCSRVDSPALAEQLRDHLSHPGSAAKLAPPPSEAWPHVAEEIAPFVNRVLAPTSTRAPRSRKNRLRRA